MRKSRSSQIQDNFLTDKYSNLLQKSPSDNKQKFSMQNSQKKVEFSNNNDVSTRIFTDSNVKYMKTESDLFNSTFTNQMPLSTNCNQNSSDKPQSRVLDDIYIKDDSIPQTNIVKHVYIKPQYIMRPLPKDGKINQQKSFFNSAQTTRLSSSLLPVIPQIPEENLNQGTSQLEKLLAINQKVQTGGKVQIGQQSLTLKLQQNNNVLPQPRNIFQDDILNQSKSLIQKSGFGGQQELFDVGPRYKINGELVPYSIIGKPDWFSKAEGRPVAAYNKLTIKKMNSKSKIFSGIQCFPKPSESLSQLDRKTSSFVSSNKSFLSSALSKKKVEEEKTEVTKERLLYEIAILEKKLAENQKQELEQLSQTSCKDFGNRFYKQEQLLEQYNRQNQKWENLIGKIGNKCKRSDNSKLLIARSGDEHRQKMELFNLLEQSKSPSEIVGANIWELSLRNENYVQWVKKDKSKQPIKAQENVEVETDAMNPLKSQAKNENDFRLLSSSNGIYMKTFVNSEDDYQISRKPNQKSSVNLNNTDRTSQMNFSTSNFSTNSKNKSYVETVLEKIPLNKRMLKDLYYSDCSDLQLKGTNKLSLERDSLLNDGRKPSYLYLKYSNLDEYYEYREQLKATQKIEKEQEDPHSNQLVRNKSQRIEISRVEEISPSSRQRNYKNHGTVQELE